MKDGVQMLVDHYQKTFELNYDMWKERNRIFLLLISTIGAATLLTFHVPEANSLLVDALAKILSITDSVRVSELRNSFPFGVLQSILLLVIFYLMVNLYHRALYVLRNYQYLGTIEGEIRKHLGLSKDSISFTRESKFYWNERSRILGSVKWFYILLLGSILIVFLIGKIIDDFKSGYLLLGIIDIIISLPTLLYFWGYAKSSVNLDRVGSK